MTGGRAAEEVVFNSITTGASNDIAQATKMARAMITRYGMTDDFDMVALETVNNAYLGGDASLACSERTAATVDDKVVEVVKQQHEKAKQMLIENRGKLDEIAKYLYEKRHRRRVHAHPDRCSPAAHRCRGTVKSPLCAFSL